MLDIGSGDGRLVVEAARMGFKSTGVELNRWLVYYSRWAAWRAGVRASTRFVRQDLWRHDTATYNNVVIFGVEQMMGELETKLERELALAAIQSSKHVALVVAAKHVRLVVSDLSTGMFLHAQV